MINILIGVDYAELHRSLVECPGEPGETIARKIPLRWTCIGSLS